MNDDKRKSEEAKHNTIDYHEQKGIGNPAHLSRTTPLLIPLLLSMYIIWLWLPITNLLQFHQSSRLHHMVMVTLRWCMDASHLFTLNSSTSPTPLITYGADMSTVPSMVPLVHVLMIAIDYSDEYKVRDT